MKILFFGDVMFGRNNNYFVENPFKFITKYIDKVDTIIFNLETVISPKPIIDNYKVDKVFNYQSNGIQLKYFNKYKEKDIIASITNNHSLDYDVYGFKKTKTFLKQNNILFSNKKYLETDELIFLNYSDHCGCDDISYWRNHINILDYSNVEKLLEHIRKLKKKNKKIIFSIHWGANWLDSLPETMLEFGKKLIDNGVDIVFGHSAHHIPPKPYEIYKNKIIIYGLGDLINDYAVDFKYKSNLALMCLIDFKKTKTKIELITIDRTFVANGSSIPAPISSYTFSIPNINKNK